MDVNDLIELLEDMQRNSQGFFIEAEAKISRMQKFIDEYNSKYSPVISMSTEGLIEMTEIKNKWGLELRLYINDCPDDIKRTFNFTTHTPLDPNMVIVWTITRLCTNFLSMVLE